MNEYCIGRISRGCFWLDHSFEGLARGHSVLHDEDGGGGGGGGGDGDGGGGVICLFNLVIRV